MFCQTCLRWRTCAHLTPSSCSTHPFRCHSQICRVVPWGGTLLTKSYSMHQKQNAGSYLIQTLRNKELLLLNKTFTETNANYSFKLKFLFLEETYSVTMWLTSHHGDQAGPVDVGEGSQLSSSQDGLHVGVPTGLPKLTDLIIQCCRGGQGTLTKHTLSVINLWTNGRPITKLKHRIEPAKIIRSLPMHRLTVEK